MEVVCSIQNITKVQKPQVIATPTLRGKPSQSLLRHTYVNHAKGRNQLGAS